MTLASVFCIFISFMLPIPIIKNQIKSSFPFLSLQTFFIVNVAAATIAPFTLRADFGHLTVHRIQEMHFPASAVFRFSLLIAFAGHPSAHMPQPTQLFVALGTRPTPPAFL